MLGCLQRRSYFLHQRFLRRGGVRSLTLTTAVLPLESLLLPLVGLVEVGSELLGWASSPSCGFELAKVGRGA